MQIIFTGSSYGHYKGFLSMNNIFTRESFFVSFFIFITHFFVGLRELAWTLEVFLFLCIHLSVQ